MKVRVAERRKAKRMNFDASTELYVRVKLVVGFVVFVSSFVSSDDVLDCMVLMIKK